MLCSLLSRCCNSTPAVLNVRHRVENLNTPMRHLPFLYSCFIEFALCKCGYHHSYTCCKSFFKGRPTKWQVFQKEHIKTVMSFNKRDRNGGQLLRRKSYLSFLDISHIHVFYTALKKFSHFFHILYISLWTVVNCFVENAIHFRLFVLINLLRPPPNAHSAIVLQIVFRGNYLRPIFSFFSLNSIVLLCVFVSFYQ